MDITALFKACVKTVRTTNKSLGIKEQKPSFLKSFKDSNLNTPRDVVKQITKLQIFILENKAAYLNVKNYLSTNKTMTELDRQQVDSMAEDIINNCSKLISDYKKEIQALPKSPQKEEHYQNVIETLERYLKNVSKLYTEAKAVRVKRVIDTHKLSKLETKPSTRKSEAENSLNKSSLEQSNNISLLKEDVSQSSINYDEQLSTEEMQMFESENAMLYNELNSISGKNIRLSLI